MNLSINSQRLISFWKWIESTREVPIHDPESVLTAVERAKLAHLRAHSLGETRAKWEQLGAMCSRDSSLAERFAEAAEACIV